MTVDTREIKSDYRSPSATRRSPRAVADGGAGTILAVADLAAAPERVFRALSSSEVERWWGAPGFYRQEGWRADLRACGPWRVDVRFPDGSTNLGSGEFAEVDAPRKLVMTRRFERHPFQGARETTITYRFDCIPLGTRLTVREEGYVGRSEAAYGNAEHWERVLGWLDAYLRGDGCDDYHVDLDVDLPAHEAMNRINRVSQWWTKGIEGEAREAGARFTARFGDTFVEFLVAELTPGKGAVWQVVDCNLHWLGNKKEWKDTAIVWDVLERAEPTAVTTVRMMHRGLVPGLACYDDCQKGWSFYVGESLRRLLTEGEGLADKEGKRAR